MVKVPLDQGSFCQGSFGPRFLWTEVPLVKVPLGQGSFAKVPLDQVPLVKVPLGQGSFAKVPLDQVPLGQVPLVKVPLTLNQSKSISPSPKFQM